MTLDFADAPTLETPRLRLRPWRDSDIEPYVAMGADPDVMAYFPRLMSRDEVLDHVRDLQERFRRWGYGYWAIETADTPFAGFVGLSQPKIDAHFTPCVEVGWRLAPAVWGRGLATEGARAALRFGFQDRGLPEIVAMVSVENAASRRVAERLGMTTDPADDFDFPGEDWPYKRSVLYRIRREKFHEQDA
ncbi:MAG: GNAT family N-acetyltransferase [Pseudomonadota bacterium]